MSEPFLTSLFQEPEDLTVRSKATAKEEGYLAFRAGAAMSDFGIKSEKIVNLVNIPLTGPFQGTRRRTTPPTGKPRPRGIGLKGPRAL